MASIIAWRFEPRPDASTPKRSLALPFTSDIFDLRSSILGRHHFTDNPCPISFLGQSMDDRARFIMCNDNDEADAHVEDTIHFITFDATRISHHRKNRRHGPRL